MTDRLRAPSEQGRTAPTHTLAAALLCLWTIPAAEVLMKVVLQERELPSPAREQEGPGSGCT